jgi:hypothetical protein
VNYLKHKKLLTKIAPLFFENLKDKYYEKQDSRLKKNKAQRFYNQRQIFFTLRKFQAYAHRKKITLRKFENASSLLIGSKLSKIISKWSTYAKSKKMKK